MGCSTGAVGAGAGGGTAAGGGATDGATSVGVGGAGGGVVWVRSVGDVLLVGAAVAVTFVLRLIFSLERFF